MTDLNNDGFTKLLLAITIALLVGVGVIGLAVVQRLKVAPSDVQSDVREVKEIVSTNAGAEALRKCMSESQEVFVALDNLGRVVLWSEGAIELFGIGRERAFREGIDGAYWLRFYWSRENPKHTKTTKATIKFEVREAEV